MQYRTLGNTGLKVSAIGFGTAPVGLQDYLGHEDRDSEAFREQAKAALRQAVAQGINYFDTAPEYGDGRAERMIGEALEDSRSRVLLATKYPCDPRIRPAQLTELFRASLDRLRTDHVDLLQLHGGCFSDAQARALIDGGFLDWADDMQTQGLCRLTGITAEAISVGLERLIRTWRFDVLQLAYSVIYQSACDYQREPTGIIPLARSQGMGIVAMRSATSGFLPRLLKSEFPDLDPARVAKLAINFVLSTPEVECALVGMKSAAEVDANAAIADDVGSRLNIKTLHDRYL